MAERNGRSMRRRDPSSRVTGALRGSCVPPSLCGHFDAELTQYLFGGFASIRERVADGAQDALKLVWEALDARFAYAAHEEFGGAAVVSGFMLPAPQGELASISVPEPAHGHAPGSAKR